MSWDYQGLFSISFHRTIGDLIVEKKFEKTAHFLIYVRVLIFKHMVHSEDRTR